MNKTKYPIANALVSLAQILATGTGLIVIAVILYIVFGNDGIALGYILPVIVVGASIIIGILFQAELLKAFVDIADNTRKTAELIEGQKKTERVVQEAAGPIQQMNFKPIESLEELNGYWSFNQDTVMFDANEEIMMWNNSGVQLSIKLQGMYVTGRISKSSSAFKAKITINEDGSQIKIIRVDKNLTSVFTKVKDLSDSI